MLRVNLTGNKAMAKETHTSSFLNNFCTVSQNPKVVLGSKEKQTTQHPDHLVAR